MEKKEQKPSRGRFDDEEDKPASRPKAAAREEEKMTLDDLKKNKGASTGAYVPAHVRKRQEEDRKKEEDAERAAEESRKKREAEKKRADAAKAEEDKRKEREKAEKKEKEQKEREAKEQAKKDQMKQKVAERKKDEGADEADAQPINEEKLSAFGEKCKQVLDMTDADVKKLVAEVPKLLSEIELRTIEPVKKLLEPLLSFCGRKADTEIFTLVEKFAPLFNCLIKEAQMRRFKVKMLREAQRFAFVELKLPRLSPACALLEAFFDGLYRADVVEEQWFEAWSQDANDDTPGKIDARFQLDDFLDWLRNAKIEGEESEEEGDDEEKNEESEDDEDDDDDIEGNIPQRNRRPLR